MPRTMTNFLILFGLAQKHGWFDGLDWPVHCRRSEQTRGAAVLCRRVKL